MKSNGETLCILLSQKNEKRGSKMIFSNNYPNYNSVSFNFLSQTITLTHTQSDYWHDGDKENVSLSMSEFERIFADYEKFKNLAKEIKNE